MSQSRALPLAKARFQPKGEADITAIFRARLVSILSSMATRKPFPPRFSA